MASSPRPEAQALFESNDPPLKTLVPTIQAFLSHLRHRLALLSPEIDSGASEKHITNYVDDGDGILQTFLVRTISALSFISLTIILDPPDNARPMFTLPSSSSRRVRWRRTRRVAPGLRMSCASRPPSPVLALELLADAVFLEHGAEEEEDADGDEDSVSSG